MAFGSVRLAGIDDLPTWAYFAIGLVVIVVVVFIFAVLVGAVLGLIWRAAHFLYASGKLRALSVAGVAGVSGYTAFAGWFPFGWWIFGVLVGIPVVGFAAGRWADAEPSPSSGGGRGWFSGPEKKTCWVCNGTGVRPGIEGGMCNRCDGAGFRYT
ncbi:hypothetical protein ABZS66_57670 [Dactylosporangium sp. NPDC005572]|uniref:hypothetical protein n=1 Tax=Dactylosporangium sp. NPDC005572 TaxID=3156889 RepID=UPI0033B98661